MNAVKVWDSKNPTQLIIPEEMGKPRDDQLQGCWFEQLSELAGRVCYDSLGKGRSSEEYHKHILEVGHLSVYEHCNFCIQINVHPFNFRPGLYWRYLGNTIFEITCNLRTLFEWNKWSVMESEGFRDDSKIYSAFWQCFYRSNPRFLRLEEKEIPHYPSHEYFEFKQIDSNWSTYFFRCSRACSHELVRHGDFTAISQRSTRYVKEELDASCLHPMLKELVEEDEANNYDHTKSFTRDSQYLYDYIYKTLLEKHGKERMKQCRGAARQVLPHYLATEIIFSASNDQWQRIKDQRCSEAADAEIRELIGKVEV